MNEVLLEVTEKYRCESEEQAKKLIENAKQATDYDLKKYNVDIKELKKKGEVLGEYSIVTLVKTYSDLKTINASIMNTEE